MDSLLRNLALLEKGPITPVIYGKLNTQESVLVPAQECNFKGGVTGDLKISKAGIFES